MFGKIKRIIDIFSTINVVKTIYLNFKVFPISIAKKLPVYVGKKVDINEIHKGSIEFPKGVEIKKGMVSLGICQHPMISNKGLTTLLRITQHGKLVLGDDIKIYSGCSIIVTYEGELIIGSDFLMNQKSRLYCANSVNIGKHVRIGWETQIYDSNFHFTYDSVNHLIGNALGTVRFGSNVWIGNRCTVAKGSSLPDYTIIGSNSLVSKKLENEFGGGIWVGMPVSLKREGFYRILDNKIQAELFSYFQKEGAHKKVRSISLSGEDLEKCLNHR